MKKNKLFEKRLSKIPLEIKRLVDLNFDLAELICNTMEKKNISYSDLAKGLNISIDDVQFMISGGYDFTFSNISKLENILNVKLIEIKYEQNTII